MAKSKGMPAFLKKKIAARKSSSSKSSGGAKKAGPKFGSPAWQAKYGKGGKKKKK